MTNNTEIRPFKIEIPQADLDEVRERLARARFTEELPGAGNDYGVPVARVRELVDYWRTTYDWRRLEARLNAYPQFTTTIDGQNVHFLHVRSDREDAFPLIVTHGWPGSIAEFLPIIEPLRATYHLVIPSVPGFGFSGPTRDRGWGPARVAAAWAELMQRLGYDRYGAVGNDWGTHISLELGRHAPEAVAGVHVTQIFAMPSGDPAELAAMPAAEREAWEMNAWFDQNGGAYHVVQEQAPQTLAHALCDSPVGLLAWIGQLLDGLDDDFLLDTVMTFWLTETIASGMRMYYEDRHAPAAQEPTTVPVGVAQFANDWRTVRTFAERDHKNVVSWTVHDTGGHWAAHDATDLLVADIRSFFERLVP